MRVAIIAPPWVAVPPPGYGGTEAVLDSLARGLDAAGHEVMLFTTADSTCPVRREWVFDTARGVGRGGAAAELAHVIAAYEAVADFDVVHDHSLVGPVYADRFPWLPVVTTNHGPFLSELGPLYRAVSDRVPVIAISHHQASTAQGVNLAGVVHHGVDVERFPIGSGSGGYALFLGRMHPDKGVHVAVRVAQAAGVPLRIAAKMTEPHELEYFKDQVQPLLGGDVEYIGEVGATIKLDLLGEAVCLLNPIGWPEPFGMVMIEALAAGTPVIATPCGAAPEIVDEGLTGYLAWGEDQLAAALPKAGDLDRHACRRAAELRFSAERMVTDHLGIYRRVAEDRDLGGYAKTPYPKPLGPTAKFSMRDIKAGASPASPAQVRRSGRADPSPV
jgi:glycosyltransferase involved in cell wall biosynthesis